MSFDPSNFRDRSEDPDPFAQVDPGDDESEDSSDGGFSTDEEGGAAPAPDDEGAPDPDDAGGDSSQSSNDSSGGSSQSSGGSGGGVDPSTPTTKDATPSTSEPPQASDRDFAGINRDAVDQFSRVQDAKGGDIQGHEAGTPIRSDDQDTAVGRAVANLESQTVTDLRRGDVTTTTEQRNGETFVSASLTDSALEDERDERREVASGVNQASDRDFAGIDLSAVDQFSGGDGITAADEVFARREAVDSVEQQLEQQTGAADLEQGTDFTVSETSDGNVRATLTDEGESDRGLDPAFVPEGDIFRDDLDEGVELGKTFPTVTASVVGARAVNDLQAFDQRSRTRGIQNRATVESRTRETVPQIQLSGQADEPDPLSGSGETVGETVIPAAQQARQDSLTTLANASSVQIGGGATEPDPTSGDGPQVGDALETGGDVFGTGANVTEDVRLTGGPTDASPIVGEDSDVTTAGDAAASARSGDLPASASAPLATGAALNPAVGAGILAGAAIASTNPSELERPETAPGDTAEVEVPEQAGPLSELEPSDTQPSEVGVPDTPLPTASELETPDRAPGSTTTGELPISASQLIQERPEDEQTPEIDEGDIVTGIGQPDQPGPSTRERQERDDLFAPEREFPTGEGSVVGRSVSEEEVTEPSVTRDRASEDASPGFGAGSTPFGGVFGGGDSGAGGDVGIVPPGDVFEGIGVGAAQTPESDVQTQQQTAQDIFAPSTSGLATTSSVLNQDDTADPNIFETAGEPARGGQGRPGDRPELPPSSTPIEGEQAGELFETGIESGEEVLEGDGFDVDDELDTFGGLFDS